MAERGRPRQPLIVTDEEREVLVRWSKRPKSPFSIAQRARIVLLAADGLTNNQVADKVGVNQTTVVKWRKRFIEQRLDGLVDEPRPGAPRTISDADGFEGLILGRRITQHDFLSIGFCSPRLAILQRKGASEE